ncbi:MAG TPA: ribonuclease P protein component [Thermoanaerobaculia bacterium]|nr:ribonuclease P protein component [Thermoanaerobaculia bacterium]
MTERGATPGSQALPREKRLAKRREFLRVYEEGRKLFARYVVLFYAANDLPFSRLGVTATRKIGKATVRNRMKRWTREVYRREREALHLDGRPADFVVNVKANATDATYRQYAADLTSVLRRAAGEPL